MADDGNLDIDLGTLKHLSEQLELILKDLNRQLEDLFTRTEKVVLSWEGEARDTCVDHLDRWDLAMQDLEGAQRWLHQMVTTGHLNYAAAHRAVLRGWGAV